MLRYLWRARPLRFTRLGVYFILFALGVGIAAINTGNNLLYLVLGILLGFILMSGLLSNSSLRGLQETWQAVGDLYAGQPGTMLLTLRKQGRFPGVTVQVASEWEPALSVKHLFYWVSRNSERTLPVLLRPSRRGLLQLKTVCLSTCFPFGLFEKRRSFKRHQEWVVFPPVRRLRLERWETLRAALRQKRVPQKGSGTAPLDLRDFRVGDPSRLIHWKISAKRQRLIVKEMEQESDSGQTVVIRAWPREAMEATAEGEEFIAFVASLVFTLFETGNRVGLRSPGAFFKEDRSAVPMRKILHYLALVNPREESHAGPASLADQKAAIDALAAWQEARGQGEISEPHPHG